MPHLFAPFSTTRTTWLPSHRSRWLVCAVAAAGVLLTVAAGCTNSSNTSAASSSSAAAPSEALAAAADRASSAGAASPGSAAAAPGSKAAGSGKTAPDVGVEVEAADRQVIRTANLTLNVAVQSSNTTAAADDMAEQKAVDKATQDVRNLASGPGYVSAAQGRGTTQSVTLRVPADGYGNVMDALEKVAPVINRQETTEDVTSKMVDISSRMQTMTASVNRVRALLSKADKIGDVISIESELSAREADLESLQRQQAALAGQTALSTITVVIQGSITGVKPKMAPVAPAPPAARSGFLGGLANGWDAVRHVGHAGSTVLGTLLPFVPVVAVFFLIGLYLRRRFPRGTPRVVSPAPEPRPAE